MVIYDGPKESLNGSLKRIIQEEGWKGLYKGKRILRSYTSALDGDIWIGEAGGHNLSQCAQVERILRRHTPAANPILQYTIFEQLKNVVERRRRMTPKDAFYLGALGTIARKWCIAELG
jgi:hypothetical protein